MFKGICYSVQDIKIPNSHTRYVNICKTKSILLGYYVFVSFIILTQFDALLTHFSCFYVYREYNFEAKETETFTPKLNVENNRSYSCVLLTLLSNHIILYSAFLVFFFYNYSKMNVKVYIHKKSQRLLCNFNF